MGNEVRLTYQERIERACRQVVNDACRGKASDCSVQHDVWCGINRNQPCNCDPDIVLTLPNGQFTVDRQGVAAPVTGRTGG